MRLARIEMIFQREEEIALKVLKYSSGTMRRWGIDIRGRTEPPGPVPGSERGGCAGSAAGPRGSSGTGSVPLPCTCHQGLVATEGSQAQRARGHQGLEATKSFLPTKTRGHQGLMATEGALLPAASPSVSALKLKLLFPLPRWPGLAAKSLLEREEDGRSTKHRARGSELSPWSTGAAAAASCTHAGLRHSPRGLAPPRSPARASTPPVLFIKGMTAKIHLKMKKVPANPFCETVID